MRPLTHEWVDKAEGDLATALRELRARKAPNYDSACFHAQQCAEKYLKACLQEHNIPFGKTHNLTALLDPLAVKDASWELLRPDARALSVYAVDFRYPGESADRTLAKEAVLLCQTIRKRARTLLGLPG